MTTKTPTLKQISEAVSIATGVDTREMYGTSREVGAAFARHLMWYIANTECGRSYNWIGKAMGRTHVTVRSGVLRIGKRRTVDARTETLLADALALLAGHKAGAAPPADPLMPVRIVGPICTPQWWQSNDANFRAGMARAAAELVQAERDAKAERLRAFINMGKSVDNLSSVARTGKSPLALPRNLCAGLLQCPTPDPLLIQGP